MSIKLKLKDKAPTFCLSDSLNQKVCLKDFQGRWVVLYFYPKDNTPGCTLEARDFTSLQSSFKRRAAVVLGISKDSCQSHRKFTKQHQLTVNLLSDPDARVQKQYGVWQKKSFMGRQFMGTVRTTYLLDPRGRIAYVWENVKAAGHAAAVLSQLATIQSA